MRKVIHNHVHINLLEIQEVPENIKLDRRLHKFEQN